MFIHSPIDLSFAPKRIISLVPSQTELLFYLQLEDKVVGITKFCIHPEVWKKNKLIVGGTKNIDLDKIHQLNPDVIIANKEENVKEQVNELAKKYPVLVTDVFDLESALQMIETVGNITNSGNKAQGLIKSIQSAFKNLQPVKKKINCCYLIWQNPFMTVGTDTFIHAMMQACGWHNMFANTLRYPEITIEHLQQCELLILSTEPYPFKQQHIAQLKLSLPQTKIILVDGAMFSWYGSRLLMAPDYFKKIIHQYRLNE